MLIFERYILLFLEQLDPLMIIFLDLVFFIQCLLFIDGAFPILSMKSIMNILRLVMITQSINAPEGKVLIPVLVPIVLIFVF
jgi:hypothetical protein